MLQFSTQTRIPALLKISLHVALVLPLVLAMAACGGGRPQQPHDDSQVWRPDTRLLLRYDTNHDGTVSRGEMEAGLKADFARIDENHNACLSPDEVSAENASRWQQDASAASPIIDWKQQGCVDFEEFAATERSLFAQLDRNEDGKLTPDELSPRRRPPPND